jgi:hypothetical protein
VFSAQSLFLNWLISSERNLGFEDTFVLMEGSSVDWKRSDSLAPAFPDSPGSLILANQRKRKKQAQSLEAGLSEGGFLREVGIPLLMLRNEFAGRSGAYIEVSGTS